MTKTKLHILKNNEKHRGIYFFIKGEQGMENCHVKTLLEFTDCVITPNTL